MLYLTAISSSEEQDNPDFVPILTDEDRKKRRMLKKKRLSDTWDEANMMDMFKSSIQSNDNEGLLNY